MTKHAPEIIFASGGRNIRMDAYLLHEGKRVPALLLLHGASGLSGGNRYIPQLAGAMAEEGFATLVVHYFQSTGTSYASEAAIWQHFECWLAVLGDALTIAAERPEINEDRLALVGYSLGAYLALAQASRDSRVGAVVEFAGGMDPNFAAAVTRLPPTFVVHGQEDRRVPFARALALEALLQQLGTPHETRFYPGEGHLLSAGAALDALTAAVEFLRKYLSLAPHNPPPS